MAVTANQLIAQQEGCRRGVPVGATTHLYQGTLAFFNATGYAVDIVAAGANEFAGVVETEANNASGGDGDINVELLTDDDFELVGTGFTQATVGEDIYASDNFTVTTSNSSTSYIGQCVGYISSTKIVVAIRKQGPANALDGAATGTTAATFTVDTDVGKPRAALMSQTGGTGDYTAFIAPPSTLSADRVFTLPADSAQTLVGATATQTLSNKTLTTPVIGAATGTSVVLTGAISSSSPTAGIGYATGAQATAVSQATDRTTGVTANGICGKITTQATSLAAQTSVAFTVTNSSVAAADVVIVNVRSGPTGTKTIATVTTVAAGSFQINLFNTDASVADTGAAILNFAVIKAVDA